MQKKKTTKPIKQIILFIIAVILLLLLIFAEDIIKLTNKNKTNLAENSENELIANEPNIPEVSAGMIPVKYENGNWRIISEEDEYTNWYNYEKGQPAYVMLNNGTYQSEFIPDMTNKKLAEDNVGVGVPDDPNIRGSIYLWIPRFAYKETGEIGYIKEETQPGGEWIVPEIFSYIVEEETKPDFSLPGVWVEKDVNTACESTITEMQNEGGIYGFIADTKSKQITSTDINVIQDYIDIITVNAAEEAPSRRLQINDITNQNRIILQIVNTNKYEPIKAKIAHNIVDQKIEIQVTYTSSGIREILDEDGKTMTRTQEDGIIYADTGDATLANGTYYFTVIDNKGNKKELNISLNIDVLYKVAYINGTDNMDNIETYSKTIGTKTTDENTLLTQLYSTTSTVYARAIADLNNAITAIGLETRTSEDEQLYIYSQNYAKLKGTSEWKYTGNVTIETSGFEMYMYTISEHRDDGTIKFSGRTKSSAGYTISPKAASSTTATATTIYYWWSNNPSQLYKNANGKYNRVGSIYEYTTYTEDTKGSFVKYLLDEKDKYPSNGIKGSYWYVNKGILSKFKLYKYDQNLNLLSAYDVDSKVLTTAPINISNKGNNKVKLTLNTTGTDYKTYISNDNTNWQEVTDITSNTAKELNVDGWDNLYIKIETNTSRINNIDVAYYKD